MAYHYFHLITLSVFFYLFFIEINGHGYMVDPINRASRWRLNKSDDSIPKCYEDNQFYCGGLTVQYTTNGGKCGECGDNWADPVPRSNENGGIYGQGVVVANYTVGAQINVHVLITTNHRGTISYQLCKLDNPDLPETDDCFQPLDFVTSDGSLTNQTAIDPLDIEKYSVLQLPEDVVCERCVLRWHYRAGNSWGQCENGTFATGCGDQETFRSCADIAILPASF